MRMVAPMQTASATASRATALRRSVSPLVSASSHSSPLRSLGAAASVRYLSFRAAPKNAKPLEKNRILETPVVENADNTLMRWVGRGTAMQMYCTFIFAGKLIYEADAAANLYEVWGISGSIASASACVFFGAKLMCDKIVTDIASCRNFGEKDEFVRLTVQGALEKYALYVSLEDVQFVEQSSPDKYKFKVGARNFSLDLSNGTCTNRKALESLLQGKPLVTRKVKQPKKRQQ